MQVPFDVRKEDIDGDAQPRKESRPSWHSSRALILGSLLSVPSLAATVGPMASVQRPSPPTSKSDIRIRRSVTALAVSERKNFVDAVLALKRARSPYNSSLSYDDQFVQWHKDRYVCQPAAHADASMMPMVTPARCFYRGIENFFSCSRMRSAR